MNDSISRQAAVDAVNKCSVKEVTPAYMLIGKADAMMELIALPPVQPKRKKGHWIDTNNEEEWYGEIYSCSLCGLTTIGSDSLFCPYCGAEMEGGDDEGVNL